MIGKCLSVTAAALALGLVAAPASAAPTTNLHGIATDRSATEEVHYGRRCWWHYGHWHCRPHYRRYYYSYDTPYYYRPRYYYGYAPGFSFYFGGGRRHWHRHW
jgi:hypothetical protein